MVLLILSVKNLLRKIFNVHLDTSGSTCHEKAEVKQLLPVKFPDRFFHYLISKLYEKDFQLQFTLKFGD